MGTGEDAKGKKANNKFQWLPEMDRLLVLGVQAGPALKRRAINKILERFPQLTRGDCWCRIRYLRRTPELAALQPAKAEEPPPDRTSASVKRPANRRWTTAEDDKLMDWAGYETVAKIAQRLHRSERAVRFRLGALGESARVTDGWSLRSLQKTLRVSPATLRRFIGAGALRVKDPRISAASVAACFEKVRASLDPVAAQLTAAALARRDDGFTAERTAELLGVSVPQVQEWVCSGRLKVVNTFVTDRSFQDFCKEHGHEFNLNLMEPAMRKWLVKEYGVAEPAESSKQPVCRAKKHALVVRACRCGRKVAGNAYFRHVKLCQAAPVPRSAPAAAPDSGHLLWAS
jgi:hypothetical protein